MLNKMNSCCLDCLADCPNAPHDEMYVCQLAWNGQFIFVKDLLKFIELERMQWDLFKDHKMLSVEEIDKHLGLDFTPDKDKHRYFSRANMLEFEVIPTEYNGYAIYKMFFVSQPDYSSFGTTDDRCVNPNKDSKEALNYIYSELYSIRDDLDSSYYSTKINTIIEALDDLEVK